MPAADFCPISLIAVGSLVIENGKQRPDTNPPETLLGPPCDLMEPAAAYEPLHLTAGSKKHCLTL